MKRSSVIVVLIQCIILHNSNALAFSSESLQRNEVSSAKYYTKNCTPDASVLSKLIDGSQYNKHRIPGCIPPYQLAQLLLCGTIRSIHNDQVSIKTKRSKLANILEVEQIALRNETPDSTKFPVQIARFASTTYYMQLSCDKESNLTLNEAVLSRLWTPNSCFVNSKIADIHDSPSRNIYLTLFSNGTVWVNYRVRVKGPCSMDLSNFPMDTQTCLLIYESFNYNNQEVRMRWNTDRPDPVYMLRPINLPDFDIQKIDPVLVRVVYAAGMWDELQVRFTFKRRYVWYFLQSYVPTYLTIFISWIAFSLGPSPKAIQARTMLGVNALLAIIMQFGSTLRKLPRVSYVKAIDVWLLGSMTFIFLSLVELAIVGLMMRNDTSKPTTPATASSSSATIRKSSGCFFCSGTHNDPILMVRHIDSCAKILFPAVYSLFNVCLLHLFNFL
ncbi:unnamed protein product [Anisakis simplex]|uniref:Ligand-gated ion channel 50 n=1 Tax=Anisakis simplex TaxID=6269 RepID=A0A0M3JRT9_ANISI|nr:unnamed protein product [Anisakis simplex]